MFTNDEDDDWTEGTEEESRREIEKSALEDLKPDNGVSLECQDILRGWFPILRERATTNKQDYWSEVFGAKNVLEEIQSALKAGVVAPKESLLWSWPRDNQIYGPTDAWHGNSPADADYLEDALARYVQQPWLQNDTIDVSAINALIFTELSNFAEEVRQGFVIGKPNWGYAFGLHNTVALQSFALLGGIFGFLMAWVFFPAAAIGLLAYGFEFAAWSVIILWGMYVLFRIITFPAWVRSRRAGREATHRAGDIIQAVNNAWLAARGRIINPTRLKALVVAAEEKGAIFKPVLHTLIDRAIGRDPTALVNNSVRFW